MKRIQLLDLRGEQGEILPVFCPLSGVDMWDGESPFRIMSFDYADLSFHDFMHDSKVEAEWDSWLAEKSELDLDVADAIQTFLSKREVFKLLPDSEMILMVYGNTDECYVDLLSVSAARGAALEMASGLTSGDSV